MGLLDFLSRGGQSGAAPQQGGIMNYGGVPIGLRLMAAGQALSAYGNGGNNGAGMALIARAKEQAAEERKTAAELAKKTEIANRLADNIEGSNPEMAKMLRADPNTVDMFIKGSVESNFEGIRHTRDRNEALNDRKDQWGHEADVHQADQAHDDAWKQKTFDQTAQENAANRLDTNANQTARTVADAKRQERDQAFELRKIKDAADAAAALQAGNYKLANDINTKFFMDTGQVLQPGSTTPGMSPTVAPTAPSAPGGNGAQTMPAAPQPQAQSAPAAPQGNPYTIKWRQKFHDDTITDTEADRMTAAFKNQLFTMASKGQPSEEEAMKAASDIYGQVIDDRNNTKTAQAAADEAAAKAKAANTAGLVGQSETADKAIGKAETTATEADNVLRSIDQIDKAIKINKGPFEWDNMRKSLPATGMFAGVDAFVSDTPARTVWNSVQTIQAALGIDKLQEIRQNSPTGGALGNTSDQDISLLKDSVARLDPTDTEFESNVAHIKELYSKIMQKNADYATDIKALRADPSEQTKKDFDELYGPNAHIKFIGE